jgi:signal transduction histidine kinase
MWRVLDNLLSNAAKYSLGNTRVHVKVADDIDSINVQAKNISTHELNEDAEKLIERFQRGDAARSTDGAGLALAIVDSIVKLHGGSLNIDVAGGLMRIRGNNLQVHSPIIIAILLSGVVAGVLLTYYLRKNGVKTIVPIFLIGGVILPLVPPYESGTIPRFIMAFAFCAAVGLISQATASQLTIPIPEEYR